ncbi:MAG: GDSL-type esterase/lipase family protein [Polyangiaceae bacterium]
MSARSNAEEVPSTMSEEAPSASPPAESPKPPTKKPRPRWFRIVTRVVGAGVLIGGVTGGALAGAWLNIMPGGWRIRAEVWTYQFHRALNKFRAENAKAPAGTVVFLGSSTIEKMPLNKLFPGAPVLNRGLGGTQTVQMWEQLDACLPKERPAGVVVNGGANDLRAGRREPLEVLQRVIKVVDGVRERFPGVPIAILEPIVQSEEDFDLVLQITYGSEVLQAWAREQHIPYIRVNRPPLVTEDGRARKDMTAADGRHPNEQAFKIIAKWIVEEGGEATAPLRGIQIPD